MGGPALIIGVLPDPQASPAWDHIKGLLKPAAHLGGIPVLEEYELVWIVTEGAIVIAAATTRLTEDRAEIILCGGSRASEWAAELAAIICRWATDEGATRVVITGRKGWGRLIGWQMTGERDGFARFERELH